jgi:hypothetical protein
MNAGDSGRRPDRYVAATGKILVVGLDTLDESEWPEGSFPDLNVAYEHMKRRVKDNGSIVMYAFDDQGVFRARAGQLKWEQ